MRFRLRLLLISKFIKNLAEYLPLTRQDECVHHIVLLALPVDRFVTVR
jgi:hypothetical protein